MTELETLTRRVATLEDQHNALIKTMEKVLARLRDLQTLSDSVEHNAAAGN